MLGFCTLITTSSPVCNTAEWTWAMDALARGTLSMLRKTELIVAVLSISFNSFDMTFCMTFHSSGSVESRHFWNSTTYSLGKSVGDDAMNCPSLIYVAPIRSNNLRSASGVENVSGSDGDVDDDDEAFGIRDEKNGDTFLLIGVMGVGIKSWTVRIIAEYACMVRTGPALGPASIAAWIISRMSDVVSSCVRSATVLTRLVFVDDDDDDDEVVIVSTMMVY
mmetsp:Transcript_7447/g.11348  ORF Transcript_7447/g.11348 Transcript_7447/m.11348 type:complete len:221 (+) Transcript_7447:1034-1696(+)